MKKFEMPELWVISPLIKDVVSTSCSVDVTCCEADCEGYDPNDCPVFVKPVIYLYPTATTDVTVKLDFKGKLTATYPLYKGTWNVTATPEGTLTDASGRQYYCLYWEGDYGDFVQDFSKGFVVPGDRIIDFLEDSLAKLGLNEREANEFIIYWLPIMCVHKYLLISFQMENYTNAAPLTITPAPDTLIRIFMTWKPLKAPIEIEPQELSAPERKGFTVIEWGGLMP